MKLSRRRFLVLLGSVVGVSAAAYAVDSDAVLPRRLYRRLLSPSLPRASTGPLDPEVRNALRALVEAVADGPVDMAHYLDFFDWRSQNLAGYKGLYEEFATEINRLARRTAGCDFSVCNRSARRQVLDHIFRIRTLLAEASSPVERALASVRERQWLLFDRYVIREVLDLFARTDAWVRLGYEGWPGMPRGLLQYRRAPGTRR